MRNLSTRALSTGSMERILDLVAFGLIAITLLGAAPAGAQDAWIQPLPLRHGWSFEVVNASDDPVILSQPARQRWTVVRFDARHAGSWTPIAAISRFDLSTPGEIYAPLVVAPHDSLRLERKRVSLRIPRAPGEYRAVVLRRTADGAVSIVRKYSVSGWDAAVGATGGALRQRALQEGCEVLAKHIEAALAAFVEPDVLTALYDQAPSTRRTMWARTMVRRGMFEGPLTYTLENAAWAEALPLALSVSNLRVGLQNGLRRAVVARFADRLEGRGAMEVGELRALERLGDVWSGRLVDALVEHLQARSETGAAEVALVELFMFARSDSLSNRRDVIDAVADRCAGSRPVLSRVCDAALSVLRPRGCVIPSFGRRWPLLTVTRPAPVRTPPPVCAAVRREWRQVATVAGRPQLTWH